MRCMRTFGEMAVIAIHEGKKMRSNLDDRDKTCMFVGYADDHSKENDLGICIIIMYVDDMLIIGEKEQIEDIASKIQKEF